MATLSVNNAAATTASFTTEMIDNGGFHESVTNPSRITIPAGADGIYQVSLAGYWDADVGNSLKYEWVTIDGGLTQIMGNSSTPLYNGVSGAFFSAMSYQNLSAGQYIQLKVRQTSGVALIVNSLQFSCVRVR